MTTIYAQWVGEQAVLPKKSFERLLELARRSEPVDVEEPEDELSTEAMMRLAEGGKTFEFWSEPGEDVYSVEDGKPV